jgi:cysteinyl-tRNA synthetase
VLADNLYPKQVKPTLLMLFNSMTRKFEEFQPFNDRKVKMYTCGPSIYLLPHIGNYRTFLYEDILFRYLEYLGYDVERALNITDVEDKAIAEAEKEDMTLKQLTERNSKIFLEELKKLGAKPPTYLPKSSSSVEQAVSIIEALLRKRYAYWYKGNVYYDSLKFRNFGRLYGLDMNRWPKEKRRFHKDTYPGNRWNLGDFILWHGYQKEDKEVYWNTSLGKGRPAWNVQDPATATQTLDFKVDIYCGGVDNLIRHHDYVIAIVESVTDELFARFWLHGEHLFVDGKKMSKSRDNIIYPKDLVEKGCQWRHMRFFLINGYYRKRLNFTYKKFKTACDRLHEFKDMLKKLQSVKTTNMKSSQKTKKLVSRLKEDFEENMNNDLHVKKAFDAIFNIVSKLVALAKRGRVSREDAEEAMAVLKRIDQVLQVIF